MKIRYRIEVIQWYFEMKLKLSNQSSTKSKFSTAWRGTVRFSGLCTCRFWGWLGQAGPPRAASQSMFLRKRVSPFGMAAINSEILRLFQHTPGTYPTPWTKTYWRNSFHLGGWGCLGYAPGVCWGSLREMAATNITNYVKSSEAVVQDCQ